MNFLRRPLSFHILWIASLITAVFWYFGNSFDIYDSAVVGGIFEFLSIPMLLLLILLPVFAGILFFFQKGSRRWLTLVLFLLQAGTILTLFMFSRMH